MDGFGSHRPEGSDERREHLDQRLRAEFLAGAEEDSRHWLGRGLTAEELGRVLRHYPGDVERRAPLNVRTDQ